MARTNRISSLVDPDLYFARAIAALYRGEVSEVTAERDIPDLVTTVKVVVQLQDRALVDEGFQQEVDGIMQELQDDDIPNDDIPKTVERPSPMQINVGGVNNLQVKWDKKAGCFRLTSVCVACGRSFERTLRGFVTKDLIIAAHELGYTIGEHCERHRSFGDHLRDLQQQEKEGDTHKAT